MLVLRHLERSPTQAIENTVLPYIQRTLYRLCHLFPEKHVALLTSKFTVRECDEYIQLWIVGLSCGDYLMDALDAKEKLNVNNPDRDPYSVASRGFTQLAL